MQPTGQHTILSKDAVTREAMAAFMRRFAVYLDAEDGTPAQADNADTVDGKHASAFVESRWVFVTADGSLSRGKGVTSVELRPGFTGHYLVTFDRAVSDCGLLATVSGQGGFATATDFSSSDVVNVLTRDADGAAAQRDRPRCRVRAD